MAEANNRLEIKMTRFSLYALYTVIILSSLNTCNSCTNTIGVDVMSNKIDSLEITIQKNNELMVSKEYFGVLAELQNINEEIEGLKISKRILYDENAIVRTFIRPDDRMIEYDEKVKILEEKKKVLKKGLNKLSPTTK